MAFLSIVPRTEEGGIWSRILVEFFWMLILSFSNAQFDLCFGITDPTIIIAAVIEEGATMLLYPGFFIVVSTSPPSRHVPLLGTLTG